MPRPICVGCRIEMRCTKNDRVVHDPRVGEFPETFWNGDRYECDSCGSDIVIGFGGEMHGLEHTSDMIAFVCSPCGLYQLDQYEHAARSGAST